ncbi:MAG: carboxypeptidase regulatory-like domain-containing protein [Methanomassiliicoccales archaeon]|nr:MAG: carboxypeptidase regulatory-like domain-containing protein [Methanomassiliicoccales archaeon]
MKEEKIENENLPKKADEKKEVHYHYHMDEKGVPQTPGPYQKRPGELHYHYYYEPPRMQKPRSSKPTIAGVLLLVQALMTIMAVVFIVGAGFFISDPGGGFMFFGGEDTGDITGTVTFLNGTPVEDATITVVGTQLATSTDENGDYLIYNVPVGNQKIKVEKEGYNTIILKTYVEPENMDMDMETNNQDELKNHDEFVLTEGNEVIEKGSYPPLDFIKNLLIVCGVILVVLSVVVLIGAFASFRRTNFKLAIAGAIAGTIMMGLFAFIALFILLLAKDEFQDPKKDTPSEGPLGGENP